MYEEERANFDEFGDEGEVWLVDRRIVTIITSPDRLYKGLTKTQ